MADDLHTAENVSGTRRRLKLFDCVCIIVGIIIGSGLYETTPLVAQSVSSRAMLFAAWALGGALALIGALCYAELAAAYPKHGGDYVFLSRAFGRPAGFLFAWMQFWIIGPATIGAMAFVFAHYTTAITHPDAAGPIPLYAFWAIGLLTAVNLFGVREGKWTQNALAVLKIGGLAALIAVGFLTQSPAAAPAVASTRGSDFGLAMILILFAYGGWSSIAYVAAEVANPRKNFLRSLVIGVTLVTTVYLLANAAFAHALGFDGLRSAGAVAAEVADLTLPAWGGKAISVLICLSALGAINGQILTEARVYFAWGREYRGLRWLGVWNKSRAAPVAALLAQAIITFALAIALSYSDAGARRSVFERLVTFAAAPVWGFMLATAVSLIMLRKLDPARDRPFRVPLYPVTPILFAVSCAYMFYSSVMYLGRNWSHVAEVGIAVLVLGAAAAFLLRPRRGLG